MDTKILVKALFMSIIIGLPVTTYSAPEILLTEKTLYSPDSAAIFYKSGNKLASNGYHSLSFELYTGNVFVNNSNAHWWVWLDGRTYKANKPYTSYLNGRGLAIGPSPNCSSIGFEHFGGPTGGENVLPDRCADSAFEGTNGKLKDFTWYKFGIAVDSTSVSYNVWERNAHGNYVFKYSDNVVMIDTGLWNQSDVAMGLAFDPSPSMWQVKNVIVDFH